MKNMRPSRATPVFVSRLSSMISPSRVSPSLERKAWPWAQASFVVRFMVTESAFRNPPVKVITTLPSARYVSES